ncbi:hypothetical protein VNO80_10808 [Phaseolus coccineus]|uniref:Uncharacterized protein n=1 Tax=Phaseolus coccineus TaxID=3886 RepID=A0AAN9RJT3_PHACN
MDASVVWRVAERVDPPSILEAAHAHASLTLETQRAPQCVETFQGSRRCFVGCSELAMKISIIVARWWRGVARLGSAPPLAFPYAK